MYELSESFQIVLHNVAIVMNVTDHVSLIKVTKIKAIDTQILISGNGI